jgi:hypothetical protein
MMKPSRSPVPAQSRLQPDLRRAHLFDNQRRTIHEHRAALVAEQFVMKRTGKAVHEEVADEHANGSLVLDDWQRVVLRMRLKKYQRLGARLLGCERRRGHREVGDPA